MCSNFTVLCKGETHFLSSPSPPSSVFQRPQGTLRDLTGQGTAAPLSTSSKSATCLNSFPEATLARLSGDSRALKNAGNRHKTHAFLIIRQLRWAPPKSWSPLSHLPDVRTWSGSKEVLSPALCWGCKRGGAKEPRRDPRSPPQGLKGSGHSKMTSGSQQEGDSLSSDLRSQDRPLIPTQ